MPWMPQLCRALARSSVTSRPGSRALTPSRTLGDFPWKDMGPGLTAEPELIEREIGADDKYLVLGSDGFFDVLSNKMIGRIACRMNSSAQKVCNALVAEARKKLSTDDTTPTTRPTPLWVTLQTTSGLEKLVCIPR